MEGLFMRKTYQKILALAGAGIMLMNSTVFAAEDTDMDLLAFTNQIQEDGTMLYNFEDVSLTIPAYWIGKVKVSIKDNSVIFYHKASQENWMKNYGFVEDGKLVTLLYSADRDFSDYDDLSYIGFSENSAMNYVLIFPTDVQGYTDDKAVFDEFHELTSELEFVKEHACMLESEN